MGVKGDAEAKSAVKRFGRATGEGTSRDRDVADPHPSNEEHYDREAKPGGADPPKKDLGANPHIHDGKPRRRADKQ
jgi:hypothetical protein